MFAICSQINNTIIRPFGKWLHEAGDINDEIFLVVHAHFSLDINLNQIFLFFQFPNILSDFHHVVILFLLIFFKTIQSALIMLGTITI